MTTNLTIDMLNVQIDDAESHGMLCDLEKQLLVTMQREEKLRLALQDIYMHSDTPFRGQEWLNYARDVALKALLPSNS